MNKYLSMFSIKVGTGVAVAMFVGFMGVLAIAPTQADHTKAESCSPVYTSPIFDPYPVTWANDPGVGCNDFAVISGGVHNVSPNWSDSFSANTGDTITLRVYIHNGAATGSGQVMNNVAYNVNLDGSTGSSHTISAQLTASNAAEKDGSLTINTPAGDSLQLVSGNLQQSIGDMQPCFDFSQVFYITLQVVGPAQPTGNNSITATPGGQIGTQCLLTGSVQWTNSSDVQSVDVTVQDLTANSAVNSMTGTGGTPNSSNTTPWLTPGDTYQYSLYNTTNGQFTLLQQTNEQVPALNCGSARLLRRLRFQESITSPLPPAPKLAASVYAPVACSGPIRPMCNRLK